MCGICGIVLNPTSQFVDPALIKRMTEVLSHRGPNNSGVLTNGHVGLGHRRLSILDLSENGNQPMSDSSNRIHIVFNGEIYNFVEIRHLLMQKGHTFHSKTDTEIILSAYKEWGIDCIHRFNGMFAFALWDQVDQTLHLVRDRLGIKPLFYHISSTGIRFGSEIKTILEDETVSRNVNLSALNEYLTLNYCLAPKTLFEGIQQLLPGQRLEYSEGKYLLKTYWELEYSNEEDLGEKFYLEQLNDSFSQSVKNRLISDVPLGTFLSGGLDSSAVTLFMTKILQQPVKTFSIGFEEATYNELPYAKQVSEKLGTNHFEQIIKPDAITLLPKIIWHSEEPTADSSMIPLYYLCELARKHVGVVLAGDGADEIFAGYETYTAFFIAQIYRKLPSPLREYLISPIIHTLPVSDTKISLEQKLKRFASVAGLSPFETHFSWRLICNNSLKTELYSGDLIHYLGENPSNCYQEAFKQLEGQTPLSKLLYTDTKIYLPNDMLVKVDRMSMAHGLEVRVPFLDHNLVELVAKIPDRYKLRYYFIKKYLLKKLVCSELPKESWKRKKAGFNVPIGNWLREELYDYAASRILEGRLIKTNWFNQGTVEKMLSSHRLKKNDYSYPLWSMLVLSIWYEQFIVH